MPSTFFLQFFAFAPISNFLACAYSKVILRHYIRPSWLFICPQISTSSSSSSSFSVDILLFSLSFHDFIWSIDVDVSNGPSSSPIFLTIYLSFRRTFMTWQDPKNLGANFNLGPCCVLLMATRSFSLNFLAFFSSYHSFFGSLAEFLRYPSWLFRSQFFAIFFEHFDLFLLY